MADVRKEILPGASWLYNPFFAPAVQSVLERKLLRPPECPQEAKLFLEAWPLIVFERSCELANEVSDIQRHSDWLWCYKLDRQFSADLLAAITRFVELPREDWDLRRALAEFENQAPSDFAKELVTADETNEPTRGDSAVDEDTVDLPLIPWKEVAAYIELNCPHLKSVWLSADRLRKKEFYSEKKRRQNLFDKWERHFMALERFGRLKWYERMPCSPG